MHEMWLHMTHSGRYLKKSAIKVSLKFITTECLKCIEIVMQNVAFTTYIERIDFFGFIKRIDEIPPILI